MTPTELSALIRAHRDAGHSKAAVPIEFLEEIMATGHKTAMPTYRVDKSGKLKPIDKTPAPLRKGKRAKASRKAKAWKAAGRKTT